VQFTFSVRIMCEDNLLNFFLNLSLIVSLSSEFFDNKIRSSHSQFACAMINYRKFSNLFKSIIEHSSVNNNRITRFQRLHIFKYVSCLFLLHSFFLLSQNSIAFISSSCINHYFASSSKWTVMTSNKNKKNLNIAIDNQMRSMYYELLTCS